MACNVTYSDRQAPSKNRRFGAAPACFYTSGRSTA